MDRLDLRLVEYFVAVAEELHFGRAAARLHIAQPSLSQQIRRLERQLGVALLDRTSRRVELTPAGRALLGEGRRLLTQSRRAVRATRAAATEGLSIGFSGSASSGLLPDALAAFSKSHPGVEIAVRELLLDSVDDILGGRVEVAFTRLLPGQTELEVEVVASQPRVVAMSIKHPLAARVPLTYADLRDERFITNPVVESSGAPARWLAEQHRHGLPGRVAAEAASIQEILTLVAAGRGICLVPEPAARHYPRDDVADVEVSDAEPAVVSLAWAPGPRRPVVDAFVQTVREVAAARRGRRAALTSIDFSRSSGCRPPRCRDRAPRPSGSREPTDRCA
jgi:DNA-binding transcriptional LysR family regulator